ncbi:minor tail protein [Gordonia phage Stormageddon]|uniref:Glycosylhydrolase n=1 Tax=Gordonia phage Stormageddon TaxID=2656541 RepID=A0A649VRK2_9CAUD|nr:minor tail protein [Gordonia phage Stormageddon]QGJ94881.1 glycosylhydrolase [Gordonia phage Stormageddon]
MARVTITDYVFEPSTRRVTLNGVGTVSIPQILSIRNQTTGQLYYLKSDYRTLRLEGNTLILPSGTVGLAASASDRLEIAYETSVPSDPGSGGGLSQTEVETIAQNAAAAAVATAAPLVDSRVPAANLPPLFRTTDAQPFAADSIWNTPIGDGCAFEASSAPATASFLAATPAINDGTTYGFTNNVARPTDPICTATMISNGKVFTFRCPYDPVISPGTDLSMRVIDGWQAIDLWKTTKTGLYTFTAEFITVTDLRGTGRNTGTRAARFPSAGGLIRAHELGKCYIPHALCISIPASSLKLGFVWPAAAEDSQTNLTYSGQVPMGSFFAIPASVDLSTLGLSPEGLALAECLQKYGMYVGDQSGSAAISVDGEATVAMPSALERLRTDWTTKLFGQLRRVTNVGTVAGGPGARRAPAAGPVAVRSDPQDVTFDILVSRLRATNGIMLTSHDGGTDVSPVVSTNASLGGKSLSWMNWPAQYQTLDGAIRRIASPDGATRILTVNPGVRDVRVGVTVVSMHSSGFAYLVAAGTGSTDGFRLAVTSGGSCHLQKIVSGGSGAIQISPSLPNGSVAAGKRVELMIYGPYVAAIIDGEVALEASDTQNITGTQTGIYFPSDTNIAWRRFTVHSVPRVFRKPTAA